MEGVVVPHAQSFHEMPVNDGIGYVEKGSQASLMTTGV
jgi:hypothetical protein